MGVLNVVMYAHNASPLFADQSFMEVLIVFSRICLIFLLDSSTYPLI